MGIVIEQETEDAVYGTEVDEGATQEGDGPETDGDGSVALGDRAAPGRERGQCGTISDAEADDRADGEQVERGMVEAHEESWPEQRRSTGTRTGPTAAVWATHEAEKRAASLSKAEKEDQADRLLAEHTYGEHYQRSRRTVSRRRAREIPASQLEASQYSGARHLLQSMAESLRLVDADEHASLSEWFVEWEVAHAIRAERALTRLEKEVLLGRIRGESLRESARRLETSHEKVRRFLARALEKYYAGELVRLKAISDAATSFYEDASRQTYRPPNCCGQNPLCLDDADAMPCAQCQHDKPEGMTGDEIRPGDLNYCPLAGLPKWLWGRR